MSNDLHFPTGGRNDDAELGRLLRPLYAAPEDDAYWTGLEARILSRVRAERAVAGDAAVVGRLGAAIRGDEAGEWWEVLSHWTRAGLAAAAVIAVVPGTLMLQHEREEARLAAEALLVEPPTYTMQLRDGSSPPRVNPTLRYGFP